MNTYLFLKGIIFSVKSSSPAAKDSVHSRKQARKNLAMIFIVVACKNGKPGDCWHWSHLLPQ